MKLRDFLSVLEHRTPNLMRGLVELRKLGGPLDRLHSRRRLNAVIQAEAERLPGPTDERQAWQAAFTDYIHHEPRRIALAESFYQSRWTVCKQTTNRPDTQPDKPILLCVVKNDLERIKLVLAHHRQLGITHFAILDNGSTDGTLEWLLEQPDADVYQILEKFQSQKKYGWINRLICQYGLNRWYLYVDSDELLVYDQCETQTIDQFIQKLDQNGNTRLGAVMLDMYADRGLFADRTVNRSISEDYCWFDSDSYTVSTSRRGLAVKGGPRMRLFSDSAGDSPLLTKHPLFYFQPGMVFESAHYLYPYRTDIPLIGAILHYKFLPSDLKRYEQIARDGNFQNNSKEYRTYIQRFADNPNLTFLYNGSTRYTRSTDLRVLSILDQPHAGKLNHDRGAES